MGKQPHNEHELELALTRLAGSNLAAVEYRDIMAGVILGQMLPQGCVVKGGTSLRLRFGPGHSRVTVDFDTTRNCELDVYIRELRRQLDVGWCDFTGDVLIRKQGSPEGVPFEYVMQPLDVKLSYRHHPWCTVRLEVAHNELESADEVEIRELPAKIMDIFSALNLPMPKPIPLMTLPFQIAQKLHGVTQRGSSRARDLIDLQLIAEDGKVDWARTVDICRRLFAYRKMQPWPPKVEKGVDWDRLYLAQRGDLPVLPSVDEAIVWANDLIARIDAVN